MKKIFGMVIAIGLLALSVREGWDYFSYDNQEALEEPALEPATFVAMDEETAASHGIMLKKSGPAVLQMALSTRGKVTLHPDLVAHILPNVSGVVKEALKNRGDPVFSGEVIAVLESREMAEIKADYLAALENEKLIISQLEREERLFSKKATSEQELFQVKSAVAAAKIKSQLTKQKLFAFGLIESEINDISQQKGEDFRFYAIKSPMNGTVIDRDITCGEYVEGVDPIYTIADLDKVWVEIGIYPKDFQNIKKGQKVQVEYPESRLSSEGTIIYISPLIEPDSIAAKAIVELDNAKKEWKPGSYVLAEVQIEGVKVPLAISKSAVQELEGDSIVFVKTDRGFEKTSVRLGRSDGNFVEVVSGLEPKDRYVTAGAFLLKADLGKDSVEHED